MIGDIDPFSPRTSMKQMAYGYAALIGMMMAPASDEFRERPLTGRFDGSCSPTSKPMGKRARRRLRGKLKSK
jgi:hypothetical protein